MELSFETFWECARKNAKAMVFCGSCKREKKIKVLLRFVFLRREVFQPRHCFHPAFEAKIIDFFTTAHFDASVAKCDKLCSTTCRVVLVIQDRPVLLYSSIEPFHLPLTNISTKTQTLLMFCLSKPENTLQGGKQGEMTSLWKNKHSIKIPLLCANLNRRQVEGVHSLRSGNVTRLTREAFVKPVVVGALHSP